MLRKHSELIEKNLPVLVEKTNLEDIIARLERKHVLTPEQIRRILNPAHNVKEQISNLYKHFMKRGSRSFSNLKLALQETKHIELSNLLNYVEAGEEMQTTAVSELTARAGIQTTASDSRVFTPPSNISNSSRLVNQMGAVPFNVEVDQFPEDIINMQADENLPVNVVGATKWKTSSPHHYKMDTYPRGCALIVNNITFHDTSDHPVRKGSENDEKRLKSLLEQLYFDVELHRDKTNAEMLKITREFSEKEKLKNVDCAVIVFMSHGAEGASEEDTEIIGINGIGLKTREIIHNFDHDHCPFLVHKPKVFIFQACRGVIPDRGVIHKPHGLEIDGKMISSTNRPSRMRSTADVFIAYAVPPGRPANRDIFKGTWFIQTIVDVFAKNACDYDLEDMMKMVDQTIQRYKLDTLDNYQNFQTVSTVTIGWNKRLFFNPGLRLDDDRGMNGEGTLPAEDDSRSSAANENGGKMKSEDESSLVGEDGRGCLVAGCLPRANCTLM